MDEISGGEVMVAVDRQRQRAQRRRTLREESEKKFAHILNAEKAESSVAHDNAVPTPPFWGRRIVTGISPRQFLPFINKTALFTGQWGFKQKRSSPQEYRDLLAEKAQPVFESLQRQTLEKKLLEPKVAYGYFPVQADGDDLIVYHTEEFSTGSRAPRGEPRQWLRFTFPRQVGRRRLCIADFFRPKSSDQFDVLGVQLVTVGDYVTKEAEKLRLANEYQQYLYLHGFGVESAEALAEYWHKYMRQELGFGGEDAAEIDQLFHQGYRGSRYSFGYPACPNLEDRAKLIELLQPEAIGVQLSENFMLIPEQSTDALVVHHPQAKYFDA
jgi:5-methyltetrahydrofolate--homocysteine methyltransferase